VEVNRDDTICPCYREHVADKPRGDWRAHLILLVLPRVA
jgi:hypothetical protein